MNKIATLGPTGTFTELAAKKYIETVNADADIVFYPSIPKVFNSIGRECELGIIPIENLLDGYVQPTLDLLLHTDLHIICELVIPIQFAFVGNALDMSDIQKIYVQFKTQGQCCRFLEQCTNAKIITTESNGESLQQARNGVLGESAIIPKHMLGVGEKFTYSIENVTDSVNNETRFIVLSKDTVSYDVNKKYKTSIVIMDATNKSGVLSQILNEFSKRAINLTSIISRPTKSALGKYHFFIDIDGYYPEEINIKQAIDEISKRNVVKILGSYSLI